MDPVGDIERSRTRDLAASKAIEWADDRGRNFSEARASLSILKLIHEVQECSFRLQVRTYRRESIV